ncbi:hypothetical protein EXS61_02110 [Candidatus Parcubacteria bacterium]|nr:hypothetical protein [Candidatus Parcubacteria bacterium]
MQTKTKHLLQDFIFILVSITVAIFLVESGFLQSFVGSLHSVESGFVGYFAIFIAGIFFTSVFTTAPAMVILVSFTQNENIFLVALLGGLGAMVGDYVLFLFMKDRVAEDFKYIFGVSKHKRIPHIFKTKLFHFFASFFGALIIASPLPDELGIAILGLSNTSNKFFLLLSFLFNAGGIFVIGFLATFIL